jgi:glycosyltransferase involved in cell wall biosynthesis
LEERGVPFAVSYFGWWVARGEDRRLGQRVRRLAHALKAARKLTRHLNAIGADVVISNSLASPVAALAAALARRPHVWYVHELFGQAGHELYFDLGDRVSLSLMNRLSDIIIVNSQSVFREFQTRIPSDKLQLIYYGIDVPAIEDNRSNEGPTLKLIHVGTVSPGKRQEDAVRAVAVLAARGLDVGLTVLGDEMPDYGSFLRRLCAELGVERRVQFVPFTADPFGHIASADCLLMCSRGEGFGRVTIEAMKLGKPVIGAESGGTAELIRDGETGLLYQVGDAEDLARKLELLYNDRTLLNHMGSRAREWANASFNLEKYANELLNILTAAVVMRSGGSASEARVSLRQN